MHKINDTLDVLCALPSPRKSQSAAYQQLTSKTLHYSHLLSRLPAWRDRGGAGGDGRRGGGAGDRRVGVCCHEKERGGAIAAEFGQGG